MSAAASRHRHGDEPPGVIGLRYVAVQEVVVGDIVCPRCVWERSASGPEAATLLAVVLRAHVEVWHPGFDDDPPPPLEVIRPPARTVRPGRRPRHAPLPVASAAG